MNISTIDLIVFIAYCLLILLVGLFVSRRGKGETQDASNYFLAGRGLAWWAIGASIIASNISAEQFVGMSGSGYAIGLAMATYEWIAALGLLIVAKFFIPIFLEKKIFTMPQFLEERFDRRVKTVMAFFWLAVFIFINLTSILYLGALTIENVMGVPMLAGIIGLAAFAGIYSIYGGLKAVALTDVIQVVFLIGGGLITTYIALDMLGNGEGVISGFTNLCHQAEDKFHLILDKSHPGYMDLPGVSVIIGGLWVANLYYWGCNQYIIQRALAAKSVSEAQNGMLFAGFIKLLIPLLVVIPGIAAFALDAPLEKSDEAYPWLLSNLLPVGVKGIAFAALTAAIVSSLASMMNSISTIFTMDIYRSYLRPKAGQSELVRTGRWASFISLLIAVCIAPLLSGVNVNLVHQVAGGRHLFRRSDRGGFRRLGGAGHEVQHLEFFFARGVGDQNLEEEAVKLGFRKLVGAFLVNGVLRGKHQEGVRQAVGGFPQGYLAFLHGFQQGGLDLGRGAVDFVRQDKIGEDRAFLGSELPFLRIIDHGAQQVRRQKVRRELDAGELRVQRARHGFYGERLGEAGHAFQQDVPLAEEAEDQPVHQRLLADDHLAYLRSESRNPR